MSPDAIYKTQATATTLFFNKIQYPQHMPRAIIYMPVTVGRLDFRHLGFKQGVQQVLQLAKHL